MKLKHLSLVCAVALVFSTMSSCVRCVTCISKDKEIKTRVCDKDYSKSDIENIIEVQENLGAKCKKGSDIF